MRRILTARKGEGQERELAAIIMETSSGDEIVVEDFGLGRATREQMQQGDCSDVMITVSRDVVEKERARLREEAKAPGRMVGAERNSPRTSQE